MHVLPEAVTVLGVGHEILGEQSQRLVLVAEREARGRYVAEQLPLGVEVRVPGRAIQHAPRAVGESGAPEDEPHPHLLVQPPERAVAIGRLVVEDREDVPRPDLLRVQAGRFFQIPPGCGEELVGGRRVRLESLGEPEISDGATYFERIGVVRFLLNRPIGVPKAEAEPRLNLAWLALEPRAMVPYAGPLADPRPARPARVFG